MTENVSNLTKTIFLRFKDLICKKEKGKSHQDILYWNCWKPLIKIKSQKERGNSCIKYGRRDSYQRPLDSSNANWKALEWYL